MQKLCSLILLISMGSFVSDAQPTIDPSEFLPKINDSIPLLTGDSKIVLTHDSIAAIWKIEFTGSPNVASAVYIDPTTTAFSPSYPTAELALKLSGTGNYEYHDTLSGQWIELGEAFTDNVSYASPIVYDDPKVIYQFPISLYDQVTDTFQGSFTDTAGVTRYRHGNSSYEVSSYGTLVYAGTADTFQDVVEVSYFETYVDSFETLEKVSTFYSTFLIKEGIRHPLYTYYVVSIWNHYYDSTVFAFGGPIEIVVNPTYFNDFPTAESNPQCASDNLLLYPIPCNDELNIQLMSPFLRDVEFEVLDMIGKLILSGPATMSGGFFKLNVAQLAQGPFILRILDNKNIYTKKLAKL